MQGGGYDQAFHEIRRISREIRRISCEIERPLARNCNPMFNVNWRFSQKIVVKPCFGKTQIRQLKKVQHKLNNYFHHIFTIKWVVIETTGV